ncbi:tetratricopeptide repeat protein [Silanimonas sp.]|jgi:predicted O-linked N-acetylglucosamine transferase (SPINDLY family)|uniref:tetratricopeptide repeat protein n=1 Tax=Silanimonas sp. TaxID=1929290 RepID=UPI0037CB8014
MLAEMTRDAAPSADLARNAQIALREAHAAHESGRLDEAEAQYLDALRANPYAAEAEHGLAWLLAQRGDWKGALPRFGRALKLRPWEKEFWISQLEALMQLGQHEAVHRLLHRAMQSGLPADAAAGFEKRLHDRRLAIIAAQVRASGKTAKQAAEAPRAALMALREVFLKREFAEARASASAFVAQYPLCAFAWRVLGASMPADERGDGPIEVLRIACDLDPEGVDVEMNLALALNERGRLDEAEALFRDVLQRQPENLRALVNRGLLLNLRGDPEAETLLRRARSLGVHDARVALALGAYLRDRDLHEEALPLLEEAMAADPANQACVSALSVCYLGVGRHEEAAALFRRLDTTKTPHLGALGIALFVGTHIAEIGVDELFALHRRFGELLERERAPNTHWENERDPARRLRVGFVSGDFRRHAMAGFVQPLWDGMDRSAFEVFAYSSHRTNDETTAQLRAATDGWCDIAGLTDERAADRIRQDGIDVLVDLSGHTAFNRLGVFALKPAPIQISSYGYPATTGLTRMDYYLADTIFAPPGRMDGQFTEKLMLGAANAAFQPPANAPDVAPLPSAGGAPFTFGSFNRMSKLTPRTVELWAAVLRATPGSRLVIGAADAPGEARLRAQFTAGSVEGSRLEFLPRMDTTSYLKAHDRIDLLLDTSPYAGGTTTCLGLWMGVPTLTVPGPTLPSRAGAAILERVGLMEFIASDAGDFVARAADFADPSARERLAAVRAGLRERMGASNIGSSQAAIETFEDGARMAWQRWCEGLPPAPLLVPPRSR